MTTENSDTYRAVAPILEQLPRHAFAIVECLRTWDLLADEFYTTPEGETLNPDLAEAVYYVGSQWHDGQHSAWYSAMSSIGFTPSPLWTEPDADSMAAMIAGDLEAILQGTV